MSDLNNRTYDVTINQIGPVSEGFLDDEPYFLKVPLPTTYTFSLRKSKAYYRWNFMIQKISEFATIESITNITKTGTNLHNNPPTTISFRIRMDRNFIYVATPEENPGPFYSIRLTTTQNVGTGYQPNDILTLSGGTPAFTGSNARFRVVTTTQAGEIVALEQIDLGYYTALPPSPASVTGGSGSGATVIFKTLTDPGLRGRFYIRRKIAEALLFDGENINIEVYDPTPTPPYHPNTKPLVPRYPVRIIQEDFVSLAANIGAAEAVITVTPV